MRPCLIGAVALAAALAPPAAAQESGSGESAAEAIERLYESLPAGDGAVDPEAAIPEPPAGSAGFSEAEAREIVDGGDVEAILAIAQGFGEAEIGTDGVGDPMITGRILGMPYTVLFYGCDDNPVCTTMTFTAGFVTKDYTEADMTAWNVENRFGKAHIDEVGDPVISMSVNLFGGVTKRNLHDTFDWWRLVMTRFAERVGF